ncbi:MAG: hypothetical protein LBG52_01520 [Candidatus Peribacteria bacterium]|nr:hypothetical protein [Candidatus Peribacteria bacterium]
MLNTKEKENQAEQFAVEIFDYCVDKKLALTYKTFDHNYDSLILYSEDYEVLESKLIECYHKYKKYDIFNTVPHFFQGTIPSVDVNHIGIVDEPPG